MDSPIAAVPLAASRAMESIHWASPKLRWHPARPWKVTSTEDIDDICIIYIYSYYIYILLYIYTIMCIYIYVYTIKYTIIYNHILLYIWEFGYIDSCSFENGHLSQNEVWFSRNCRKLYVHLYSGIHLWQPCLKIQSPITCQIIKD